MPVAAGVIVYLNELFPGIGDIQKLRREIRTGLADVRPSKGSEAQRILATGTAATEEGLPIQFRIDRAIQVFPVTLASKTDALKHFDAVVARIEKCRSSERLSGAVIASGNAMHQMKEPVQPATLERSVRPIQKSRAPYYRQSDRHNSFCRTYRTGRRIQRGRSTGNRQRLVDWLDPPLIVEEVDQSLNGRSNSDRAEHLPALRRISCTCRNSRLSRSKAFCQWRLESKPLRWRKIGQ